MTKVKNPKQLGKLLRQIREKLGYPLIAVTGFLKDDHKINCSVTNLAKIERGEFNCKANLLASLCLIYEVSISDVVYINPKKSKNH
jgi:DNA-binding Xre family transcriptional regulator